MQTSNLGEFGQVLTADLRTDASVNVGLEFILTPQLGPRIVRDEAEGVFVGSADKIVGDVKLLANQYVEYTVKAGDLDRAGLWRKQGAFTQSSTKKVVGDAEIFTVLP